MIIGWADRVRRDTLDTLSCSRVLLKTNLITHHHQTFPGSVEVRLVRLKQPQNDWRILQVKLNYCTFCLERFPTARVLSFSCFNRTFQP